MKRNRRIRLSLRICLAAVVLIGTMLASLQILQVRANDLTQMYVSFAPRDDSGKYVYLSDLALDTTRNSTTAWGQILMDQATGGGKINLRYDGSVVPFDKGIFAHATSDVYYNLEELGISGVYDYLTAFVGINTTGTKGNGVIFEVYGSADGTDWTQIYNEARKVAAPNTNAEFIKVRIKDYKYLRLYAYDNNGNGSDHAVWADARLVKEGYNQYLVPTVAEFDAELKANTAMDIVRGSAYELTLLRRTLIKNVGQYALTQFVSTSAENRATLEWLYNDVTALRYYLTGGKPLGNNYLASLGVLSRLHQAYGADLRDNLVTENGVRRGDLYERMMIAESLVYSAPVGAWYGGGQLSDPVKRYEAFKGLYLAGKLKDQKVFESLEVEEMRWVVHVMLTDPEVAWLNYYSREKRNDTANPYAYITYRFGYAYGKADYRSEENRAKWDEKYNLAAFGVPYGDAGAKTWIVFEEGSVCGGLSKTGASIWQTWGYPAAVIGQPAHAAYLAYSQDEQGRGKWGIGNSIAGWYASEKSERLPLGWGSNSWDSYYQVSYVPYAQAAINDMDNYIKAYEVQLLVDLYNGDYDKMEQVYRKALTHQAINMDAWYALIQLYLADGRKVEADFVRLADDIAEALKYYPLPMWDLTNLVKGRITSAVGQAEFARARKESLEAGKVATEAQVLQSGITQQMANYLLSNNDLSVAKFSFDGEKAGKIVLAEKYQDPSLSTTWQYSIDAKQTWSEPISTMEWQLTADEIARITVANDVVVCIIGTKCGSAYVPGQEDASYAIDIVDQAAPTNLYANDLENRVVGANNLMEWRYAACADEVESCPATSDWVSYAVKAPDLTGNKVVRVRFGANGTKIASDFRAFSFTTDTQTETRKYIPVARLSIAGVSSEATGQGRPAVNAIDGNYNTIWHSDWGGGDTQRYITIKINQAGAWLKAVEYAPAGGGNGKLLDGELYGSTDGENWEVLATAQNWANNETIKSFELEEPKEVRYIKIHATRASNGNWFTARMFNLYQDATRAATLADDTVQEPSVPDPDPETPSTPDVPEAPTVPETPTTPTAGDKNTTVAGGATVVANNNKPAKKPNGTVASGNSVAGGATGNNSANNGTSTDGAETDKETTNQPTGTKPSGMTVNVNQEKPAENKKPDAGFDFKVLWWAIGGIVVMGLIAGGMMVNNRRR